MYSCTKCDAQYPKWQGRCDECGQWSTLVEEAEAAAMPGGKAKKGGIARSSGVGRPYAKLKPPVAQSIADMRAEGPLRGRVGTGWEELDAVLGGGLMPGGVTLIAGEPGIGKSTLALQLARNFKEKVLYVAGEESPAQIADRAARLGLGAARHVEILATYDIVDALLAAAKGEWGVVVVDSVQTLCDGETEGAPGSIGQVKAVAGRLVEFAKRTDVPVIIIGHVTKEGGIAGPKALEHVVDTVCLFESDTTERYRLLKVQKNRFGSADAIAVWEMKEDGLHAVPDVETVFLPPVPPRAARVLGIMLEGKRPFLLEIQALVTKTGFQYPERTVSGFELSRLKMLLAVLQRYGGVSFHDEDVFINVVGGWKVSDPGLDAAVMAALLQAKKTGTGEDRSRTVVAVGEAGLDGSIRAPKGLSARLPALRAAGKDAVALMPSSEKEGISSCSELAARLK